MMLSGGVTTQKQIACQRSLQSFSGGMRQERCMIHFFEGVFLFTALMFFPVYVYWTWEVVVWIKKLFS
jgi:hypothetical protein